jgi:hypothetical protein
VAVALLKEPPLSPDSDLGPYRRRDYEALPDEPRCELIYGRLYLGPSPSRLHQTVLLVLLRLIDDIAVEAQGQAFVAPLFVVEMPAGPEYRSRVLPEIHLDLPAFWKRVEDRLGR